MNEALDLWAVKRAKNIRRMLKQMRKDDAYLFRVVNEVLRDYADLPQHLGDDSGSLLLGGLANLIHNKYMDAIHKNKRTKKRKS